MIFSRTEKEGGPDISIYPPPSDRYKSTVMTS